MMRAVLIFANILLACILAQGAIQWLNEPSVDAEVATSVSKERRSSAPQPRNIQQQMNPQRQYASVTPENQIATTVALNIFDPERAPQAVTNRRTAATPVNRADMTLVGTFTIGDIAGAIILQRSQQMQQMRQQMGRNNQTGNTNNAEELAAAQEQQMQQALENRDELTTLLRTLQQTEGVTDQQTELIRQRLERSNQQVELLQNQNQQRNTGRDGLTADGTMATANASNSNKQYIRVGETLSNGYTLAAVSRTSATLTRNQETIEITMQDASANAGRAGMGGMMGGAANRMGGMGGLGGGMDFGGGLAGGAGGFGGGRAGGAGGFGGGMDFGGGMGGGGFGGGGMGGGMGGGPGGGGFGGGGMGGGMGGGGGFGGGNAGGGATASFGGGGGNNRAGGNTTTRAGGGNTRTGGGGFGGGNAGGGRAGGGGFGGGGRGGR